ncbi:MAG: peroxide stress protein YaaA [Planctomycetota bacterium]
MLAILSPAKSLDFESPSPTDEVTKPQLLKRTGELMNVVRDLSPKDLSNLMSISDKLAELNFERNQEWKKSHTAKNSKVCLFAFQGDVYQGLEADSFNKTQIRFCQKHVRILSGLYGVLRPLDLIQPYRLEMGTKLKTEHGDRLYDFWGGDIHSLLASELKTLKSKFLVNLASKEYSDSAKLKQLQVPVISPAFKDWKNGKYKIISFYAKKARGMMVKYMVDQKVKTLEDLQGFNYGGYEFSPDLSTEHVPTFTRRES